MTSATDFPTATLIPVDGVTLEVFEAGRHNAGNPIVLCHGWPELAFSWRHQIPALAEAGFHVLAPNQRGYGNSSCPSEVTDYDITKLSGDLVGLLDHFGYDDAVFVGHDWGATVIWWLALLHPQRVRRIINLSVPYFDRGQTPWIEGMEEVMGPDAYFVHFNRQPGVAEAAFERDTARFLRNLYRKNVPMAAPEPGMHFINLAEAEEARGDLVMTEEELAVFVDAFESTGFAPGIHWYRNLDRNWHLLADVEPTIEQPALMIYGDRDPFVARSPTLEQSVPNVSVIDLDCGHWIQQEKPAETTAAILNWLRDPPARAT